MGETHVGLVSFLIAVQGSTVCIVCTGTVLAIQYALYKSTHPTMIAENNNEDKKNNNNENDYHKDDDTTNKNNQKENNKQQQQQKQKLINQRATTTTKIYKAT